MTETPEEIAAQYVQLRRLPKSAGDAGFRQQLSHRTWILYEKMVRRFGTTMTEEHVRQAELAYDLLVAPEEKPDQDPDDDDDFVRGWI
jgi:hypothetical protein